MVSSSENGFIRIWNATSYVNTRSVSTSGVEVTSVSFSPDGQYVAAGLDDDTMQIYYSSNLTSVHGSISVDVGSGDYVYDVEFSPDSTLVAVSIGRSGNSGTRRFIERTPLQVLIPRTKHELRGVLTSSLQK